jgi:hypothetical protein
MALGVCARDVAGVCGDQKLGCGVKWDALHCRIVGESEFGGLGTHVDCSIMSPVATPLTGVVVTIHYQRCRSVLLPRRLRYRQLHLDFSQ